LTYFHFWKILSTFVDSICFSLKWLVTSFYASQNISLESIFHNILQFIMFSIVFCLQSLLKGNSILHIYIVSRSCFVLSLSKLCWRIKKRQHFDILIKSCHLGNIFYEMVEGTILFWNTKPKIRRFFQLEKKKWRQKNNKLVSLKSSSRAAYVRFVKKANTFYNWMILSSSNLNFYG
jgi:hypothetical protein